MLLANVIMLPVILCYGDSSYLVSARFMGLAVNQYYDFSSCYGVSLCDGVGC